MRAASGNVRMVEQYDVSARAYLRRARELMHAGSPAAKFHAAFELRAGLEARIAEYLAVWDHVSAAAKKEWRIKSLDHQAKKAFSNNSSVGDFTFFINDVSARLLYTPVRAGGRQAVSRLGYYLHAQRQTRDLNDPWWTDFSALLVEAEAELAFAVSGTLLGPVLGSQGNLADVRSEVLEDQPLPFRFEPGANFIVKVDYHPASDFEIPPDAYAWRG